MQMPYITAEEVAAQIENKDILALGGFAPAGTPKAILPLVAEKARREHDAGREFKVDLLTGASIGDTCEETMAKAEAVDRRIPFCSNRVIRACYNAGTVQFVDPNLSNHASLMRQGIYGVPTWAIVEASSIEVKGSKCRVYLTAGVGIAPTICRLARKGVFIELNTWHHEAAKGLHDIYEIENLWERSIVNITSPVQCIGKPYLELDAERIKGIVLTNLPDESQPMAPSGEITTKIGGNVAQFVHWNMRRGILNPQKLVFQSGVGSGANAVMGAMGQDKSIPDFSLYTEVFQDESLRLMREGRVKVASTGSLTIPPSELQQLYKDIDMFKGRLVMRPSEVSNCPEVISRLGVCALNTALEVDIYGHANSTKVCGSMMMNGVGGSLDYTTSSALSIFTCGSTAKDGKISSIVPFCSHVDHTEHHIDAIATEYGVADMRGRSPRERADLLIEIAHPDYRPLLREYQRLSLKRGGHTPHVMSAAFAFHDTYLRKGDMRLVDWKEYLL